MKLRMEALEGRETPSATGSFTPLSAGGDGIFALQLQGPGPHTVSIDPFFDRTNVTIDGAQVLSPKTSDVSAFYVVGDRNSQNVVQNNSAVNFVGVGGDKDDTFFGGRGAVNTIIPLAGNDVAYSIVGGSQIDTVTGSRPGDVDRVFVNTANAVAKKPQDPQETFFAPGRTPGMPYLAQEADGVLYITPSNNGSVVHIAPTGPASVEVSYDLGDGKGPREASFGGVVGISYFGGSGNDVYVNDSAIQEAAYGGGGNDFLAGGVNSPLSVLKGLAGADTVIGRAARNDLSGNAGADTIVVGGPNVDVLRVDAQDTVVGAQKKDIVISP